MIKVGISQCLLGAKVRYDGGHRNNKFCQNELAELFDFVALCPEVGIGLPTPRKTIRLVGDIQSPRAVFSEDDGSDFTQALSDYADQHSDSIKQMSGYIFCKASPSCGTERVKVYNASGQSEKKGMGIYAARIAKLFPNLPIEEDGRLNDPLLRDSFIKRIYVYKEWQDIQSKGIDANALYQFHARHKFTLLAHCQKIYRELGPLVASANTGDIQEIAESYISLMMQALKMPATRRNNTNVLMHLQGYLKEELASDDRTELAKCIMDYHDGIQPILAPITLLKHHFKNHPNEYISQQSFLNPYPKELAIRVVMQ
ncbi:YbgA family protein [Aliikangiella sp. IMCC44632]